MKGKKTTTTNDTKKLRITLDFIVETTADSLMCQRIKEEATDYIKQAVNDHCELTEEFYVHNV